MAVSSLKGLSTAMIAHEVIAGILAANARIESQTFLSWLGDGAYEHLMSEKVGERLLWLARSFEPLTSVVPEYSLSEARSALGGANSLAGSGGRFDLAVLVHREDHANAKVDPKLSVPIGLVELKREWVRDTLADNDLKRLADYVSKFGSATGGELLFGAYGFFVYHDADRIDGLCAHIGEYISSQFGDLNSEIYFSPPSRTQSRNVDRILAASAGVVMFGQV